MEPSAVILLLENIAKSYGRRRVLDRVSLSVTAGDAVTVVGPNGSGKSTLLKIVAGLLRPSRGSIEMRVEGAGYDLAARRRAVGYAGPDLALYPELTGCENLTFFSAVRGLRLTPEEARERLDAVGLPGRGDDPVAGYSSGMRQRLRLAFALLGSPRVLLLDEPSLALDADGVAAVEGIVARQSAGGGITLLATNDPREIGLGERSLVLGG